MKTSAPVHQTLIDDMKMRCSYLVWTAATAAALVTPLLLGAQAPPRELGARLGVPASLSLAPLDTRLVAALQLLAQEERFPEDPILFTHSDDVLGRLGSVLQRDSTLAAMARVSEGLGYRVETRVLDAMAECDVVIVPATRGGPSGQACRDPEGIVGSALIVVVTRHDEERTTVLIQRWAVARTPTFHPLHGRGYTIDVEGHGADLEARVQGIEIGSYRFPDGGG